MKLTSRLSALPLAAMLGVLAIAAPANAATSTLAAAGTCGAGTQVFSAWSDTARSCSPPTAPLRPAALDGCSAAARPSCLAAIRSPSAAA